MNIGDALECAIWMDGTETPDQVEMHKKTVQLGIDRGSAAHNVIVGPLRWTEKKPGEDRVPPVPDHIQGPDVRLLVGEAVVTGHGIAQPSRFLDELEPDDLRRLRRITRRAYARMFPNRVRMTDRQCDTIINDLGPEAALGALRANDCDVSTVLH